MQSLRHNGEPDYLAEHLKKKKPCKRDTLNLLTCTDSNTYKEKESTKSFQEKKQEKKHYMSPVTCHLSGVQIFFFFFNIFFLSFKTNLEKVVELVGGGSVINGAYPV